MKIIKHILTGIDGETYDPARVIWVAISFTFIVGALYGIFHGKDFNMQDFGIGSGALLGGGGAGVAVKSKTEPGA